MRGSRTEPGPAEVASRARSARGVTWLMGCAGAGRAWGHPAPSCPLAWTRERCKGTGSRCSDTLRSPFPLFVGYFLASLRFRNCKKVVAPGRRWKAAEAPVPRPPHPLPSPGHPPCPLPHISIPTPPIPTPVPPTSAPGAVALGRGRGSQGRAFPLRAVPVGGRTATSEPLGLRPGAPGRWIY